MALCWPCPLGQHWERWLRRAPRMEWRARRTRLHLIASLQALSLTWLQRTDELRQWTRAHNRKKWILITASSGGRQSWLEPAEAVAERGRGGGCTQVTVHEAQAGSALGTRWSFRMLIQYTGEHPQVHREQFYCRHLVLMTGCVICVRFPHRSPYPRRIFTFNCWFQPSSGDFSPAVLLETQRLG